MKTVDLTPNYKSIHARFAKDAVRTLENFARKGSNAFSRREVYTFVSSLNIALSSVTSTKELDTFRANLQEAAVKMFDQINTEEEY